MSEGTFDNPRVQELIKKPWFLGAAFLAIVFGGFIIFSAMYLFVRAVLYGAEPAFRDIGILVLAIFGAPFVIWRSIVAQGNLDRSKDRDYADLFTKAVEQLGATREVRVWDEETKRDIYRHEPNIEVRLGAVYALERISQDSERDHIAVMEVLCAYVRENASSRRCDPYPISLIKDWQKSKTAGNREASKDWWETYKRDFEKWISLKAQPRTDVQVVIDVLGRRSEERVLFELGPDRDEPKYRLDLQNCNLRNTSFMKGNYSYAMFHHSFLEGSKFFDANLDDTEFWMAHLEASTFENASVKSTRFFKDFLHHANFRGSKFYDEAYFW